MSFYGSAARLISLGFSVIPLDRRGKVPLTAHGFKDASREEAQVEAWWREWPEANIGLIVGESSRICVLDVDPRNGGEASLKGLEEKFGPLPKTVAAATGGGGKHYYFKYAKRFFVPREYNRGLDVKKNGYVVVPPSIHLSGKAYEWLPGLALGEFEIAVLPQWLIQSEEVRERSKFDLKSLLDGVEEGKRNNAMASLAGHLFARGHSPEEVKKIALLVNKGNMPPLDDREVEKVVESIQRKNFEEALEGKKSISEGSPEEINDFLKRDIPPVHFIVDKIIQKNGRTMISAAPNKGKSLLAQNIALAMTSTMGAILNQFKAKNARVLYLDFEMGESLVKERFEKMLSGDSIGAQDLFIKCLLGKDILDPEFKGALESWIQERKIEILVIDPIGSAWSGDENSKEEVSKLTSFLDSLIDRFHVSILIVHHWRKAYQKQKGGGEMAAGSYKFNAWVDVHITLDGESSNLTLSCEKARATPRFPPIRAKLNTDTMLFEYVGDFEKKYTDDTLVEIYSSMGQEWVSIPDLIAESKKKGSAGKDAIRALLKNSQKFEVDTSGKAHRIRLKLETPIV